MLEFWIQAHRLNAAEEWSALKKKKVTSNTHYIHSFSWRFYFYFIYLLLTCPSCISFTIGPFKKKKKKSSKNQNNYMCDLFTCDIFLINAWRSNQNPSIYNQHKQCQLSDMLLTVWTHKQLDTVIYSTKVLAKWKSGEKKKKKKRQLSVTFSISQDLDDVFLCSWFTLQQDHTVQTILWGE